MDPDLVRLILVVFGVVLVAGIYLWDRYKRSAPKLRVAKRNPASIAADSGVVAEVEPGRAEPTMEDLVESIPEMRTEEPRQPVGLEDDDQQSASVLDPEPADIGDWSETAGDQDPQFSMELDFDAHQDNDYLSTDPALYDEVERKIVVVNLVRPDGVFSGDAIEKACSATGLVPGEMSIYHRHDADDGPVLFSMASMLEPGNFPIGEMQGFVTPGLLLFTQLPGARDGVEIYEQMLSTAERLAKLLHAELQDEGHNKLTRQMQEHTRESIIEHRRKIRLTRSRH
jgi:cell division protein ZipA